MSKFLEEFDIEEKPFSYLAEQYSNLTIENKILDRLDVDKQVILTKDFNEFTSSLRSSSVRTAHKFNTINSASVPVHDQK